MNKSHGKLAILPAVVVTVNLLITPVVHSAQAEPAVPNYSEKVKELEKILSAPKNAPKINEHDKAVMEKAAMDLVAEMPKPGIQVGAKAPDFSLKNPYGKTIKLSTLLKKGPVILTFYRGAWCPYCNLQLHQLKQALPQFKKHGASLVAITPQTPDKSVGQFKQDGFPFEVLSDMDYKVIKAYKLLWKVPPELDATYRRAYGLSLEAFNGPGRLDLPIPGTFVIDRAGIVRAAFANTDWKKRMEPVDILAALQKLPKE
ncbi:MAG: AhpC/TSA family protein [Gammaproteobacteria bacterium]|nr:AhpC/TSA family protein [Gammaproteobacteria bacterium]